MIQGSGRWADGGHEVGQEAGSLAAALDQNGLMIRHVPGRRERADAGQDLRLPVDELERDAAAKLCGR